MIDLSVAPHELLDLMLTTTFPFGWVLHHTGPDHAQIHVHRTMPQMLPGFNRRGMIAVLPEDSAQLNFFTDKRHGTPFHLGLEKFLQ
jgi:hypothetical protein